MYTLSTMQKILAMFAFIPVALAGSLFAAPEIGEKAPGFSLVDSEGKTHNLSDYLGKHVVLEWINHGCPFVQKHYGSGNMQALQKRFTEQDVIWLAISTAAPGDQGHMTPEEARTISEEKGACHTALLFDAEKKVARAYGAKATPHMYVINPDGNLIYQGAIDSIPSDRKADLEKAENYVAAALTASLEGKEIERPVTQAYGCAIKF